MIAILDAAYGSEASVAACVIAADWDSASALGEYTHRAGPSAEYKPGEFYKRELPLLLSVLGMLPRAPDIIVVDGYVWLDIDGRKGMGAHLYEALERKSAIVGIAKTKFEGADKWASKIRRGGSLNPLYVTAAGMSQGVAAVEVMRMHGANRLPELVGQADRVARAALKG